MISVSSQYEGGVYSPSRKTTSKIIFQIVDTTALDDASTTVSSEAIISKKDQIFNTNIDLSGKLATFENNYWSLDGSFVLPPKISETGYEVGWLSNNLSNVDGTYTISPQVTINFTSDHSSIGLTIFFDVLTNEYASDFVIDVYNSVNSLIHSESVTNNTLSKYILEQNISNYRKIVVTITKWANGYRRARISEFNFGIVEEYTDNEVIKMNILEEVDTISNKVSSNEMKFTLDNQDKRFNLLNPSGIYPYLQRRQKIQSYIGVEKEDTTFEYIPMGIYYLNEWQSDEGTLTASFTARDMMDILAQSTYRKGKYQTRTLYDLAEDVLIDAGVENYEIDIALQSISTTGYIPLVKHREALQTIAIAGQAVLYCDRYGKVILKKLTSTPLSQTIDFDNVYKSPQIKLDKLINTVDVNVNNFTAQASPKEIYKGTIAISGTQDLWIEYNSRPCQSVTASASGGTINTATYYSNAALLNITASGNVTITANGTVLDISSSIYELIDNTAPSGEQSLTLKINNSLISSASLASSVANWVLDESQKRFLYDINWRMNPALEIGDIITVEDDYSEDKTMRITKQQFNYSGYLQGKTNGKGGGS